MPQVTIRFRLPEEQGDYDAARLGRDALLTLWEIDQHCRPLMKHGSPTPEQQRLAQRIREMIPAELLDV
jgi:hypothetical protein